MKPLKALLLFLLVIVIIGTGTSVASARGLFKPPAWISQTLHQIKTVTSVAAPIPPAMSEQVGILSNRLNTLGSHSDKVLGDYIQKTPQTKPIYERTIEYAKYLYCQQVVYDYQQQQSTAASSTPSASPAQ